MTVLEERGAAHGLRFIQLDGNVGVLANGAGLTMTTMDVIDHFGGRPANFLEIGGEAYTKAEVALDLVLSNPGVKSLVVNFCGAFARTDVMADGVVRAWEKLQAKDSGVFHHSRHRRRRGGQAGARNGLASSPTISWKTPSRRRSRRHDDLSARSKGSGAGDHRQAGNVLGRAG